MISFSRTATGWREFKNLGELIALGTITNDEAVANIQPRRAELARIETQPRRPRAVPLDIAKLRAGACNNGQLSGGRVSARNGRLPVWCLRRLVGPLTLWDDSERPDFVMGSAADRRVTRADAHPPWFVPSGN